MKDLAIQLNDNSNSGLIGDIKIDVVKDQDNKIVSGLCIGSTLNQNKALLLMIQPGELKNHPTIGVGLADAVLTDNLLEYRHKIRRNFESDGLKIIDLDLYDLRNVKINAEY